MPRLSRRAVILLLLILCLNGGEYAVADRSASPIAPNSCCLTAAEAGTSEGPVNFFANLFDTSNFPPRWYCGSWPADLGWLHIISDTAIFAAYFAIPCILLYFIRRRDDLPFSKITFLFAAFILACGFGHLLEAIIFWWPAYRFAGLLKACTAIVSCITAIVLLRITPQVLELPSAARLAGQLQETVKRFDCAIAAAQIGVWEWHIQEDVLYWDERIQEMLNLEEDRVIATVEEFLDHLDTVDRRSVEAAIERTLTTGAPYEVRYCIHLDDGSVRHLLAHGQLVYDSHNEPERLIGVCIDRTDVHVREEQLAASEDRYRATFEQAAMGIAHVSPEGNWLRMNRGLCDIVGYTTDELLGIRFQDITHPDDLDADLAQVKKLLDGEIDHYSMEKRYIHKNGQSVWVNLSVSLIHNSASEPLYFIAVVEDIQERKATELALRQMTQQFEQLLESELLGIMTCRLDGSVEQANAELRRILGWPEERPCQDLNWLELTPADRRRTDEAVISRLKKSGAARPWQKEFIRQNGTRVPVVMGLTPIDQASGLCIAFVLDATRQKQTEKKLRAAKCAAEQASAAKSEFLATMSHELRTPLNGVIGMTNLLMETPLNQDQLRYAQACQSSGKTLLALICDILDLSKIEAGRLELEQQSFDLTSLLHEIADSNRPSLEEAGLKFETKYRLPETLGVRGDQIRLLRVLMNLLGNAGKFTAAGSVRLEAAIEELTDETATVRFGVSDTGIGIAEDRLHCLFDAFTQVDSSITRRYGGSGLGLAICKRLVEAMQGEIGVDSKPDVGSHFWFRIQFVRAEIPNVETRPDGPFLEQSTIVDHQPTQRVLIAEDNEINQLFATEYLHRIGWECDVVETGKAALLALENQRYDLILMDCRMPEMDGLTATREIRRREEQGEFSPRIPILALTANALTGDREQCLKAGMDGYLTKPFSQQALLAEINKIVAQQVRPSEQKKTASQSKQEEPIDLRRLIRQCGGDIEFAESILATFVTTCRQRIEEIDRHYEQLDWQSLAEVAHALKGTAGQLGALPLEKTAITLEEAANSADPSRIAPCVVKLESDAGECIDQIEFTLREHELVSLKTD